MKKKKNKSTKDNLYTYGIYTKIIENEKHYTVLQAKYKTSAAYWLLIIFIAIGIIFSSEESGLPLDHMIATILICIIGIIGILFIWYEDTMIQERFLNINQLEATKLEKKHSWLPQVHHQHLIVTHKTMIKLKNIFYVGCNLILFIILASSFIFYFIQNILIYSIGFIILLMCFLFLSRIMFIKAYKNELNVLKETINDRKR